jgi:hypothetical protein
VTARELSGAHEHLKFTRTKYWTHIERHHCTKS